MRGIPSSDGVIVIDVIHQFLAADGTQTRNKLKDTCFEWRSLQLVHVDTTLGGHHDHFSCQIRVEKRLRNRVLSHHREGIKMYLKGMKRVRENIALLTLIRMSE